VCKIFNQYCDGKKVQIETSGPLNLLLHYILSQPTYSYVLATYETDVRMSTIHTNYRFWSYWIPAV